MPASQPKQSSFRYSTPLSPRQFGLELSNALVALVKRPLDIIGLEAHRDVRSTISSWLATATSRLSRQTRQRGSHSVGSPLASPKCALTRPELGRLATVDPRTT
jgi:hypothetical protein